MTNTSCGQMSLFRSKKEMVIMNKKVISVTVTPLLENVKDAIRWLRPLLVGSCVVECFSSLIGSDFSSGRMTESITKAGEFRELDMKYIRHRRKRFAQNMEAIQS